MGGGTEQGHVRISGEDSISRGGESASLGALQLSALRRALAERRVLRLLEERRTAESERVVHTEGSRGRAAGSSRSQQVFGGRHVPTRRAGTVEEPPLRGLWDLYGWIGLDRVPRNGGRVAQTSRRCREVGEGDGNQLGR